MQKEGDVGDDAEYQMELAAEIAAAERIAKTRQLFFFVTSGIRSRRR